MAAPRTVDYWNRVLYWAADRGDAEKVEEAILQGATVNYMTPLHVAASKGFVDVIKVLLSYGADISLKDHRGRSALDIARGEAVIQLLSEHCHTATKSYFEASSSTPALQSSTADIVSMSTSTSPPNLSRSNSLQTGRLVSATTTQLSAVARRHLDDLIQRVNDSPHPSEAEWASLRDAMESAMQQLEGALCEVHSELSTRQHNTAAELRRVLRRLRREFTEASKRGREGLPNTVVSPKAAVSLSTSTPDGLEVPIIRIECVSPQITMFECRQRTASLQSIDDVSDQWYRVMIIDNPHTALAHDQIVREAINECKMLAFLPQHVCIVRLFHTPALKTAGRRPPLYWEAAADSVDTVDGAHAATAMMVVERDEHFRGYRPRTHRVQSSILNSNEYEKGMPAKEGKYIVEQRDNQIENKDDDGEEEEDDSDDDVEWAGVPSRQGRVRQGYSLYVVVPIFGRKTLVHLISAHCKRAAARPPYFRRNAVLGILYQLATAVRHMQNYGVVHRNIAPSTILIEKLSVSSIKDHDWSHRVMISEFGKSVAAMSVRLDSPYIPRWGNAEHELPPPEVAMATNNDVLDYSKADVWAIGVVGYRMVFGAMDQRSKMQGLHTIESSGEAFPLCGGEADAYNLSYWEDVCHIDVAVVLRMLLARSLFERSTAEEAVHVIGYLLWGPLSRISDPSWGVASFEQWKARELLKAREETQVTPEDRFESRLRLEFLTSITSDCLCNARNMVRAALGVDSARPLAFRR